MKQCDRSRPRNKTKNIVASMIIINLSYNSVIKYPKQPLSFVMMHFTDKWDPVYKLVRGRLIVAFHSSVYLQIKMDKGIRVNLAA